MTNQADLPSTTDCDEQIHPWRVCVNSFCVCRGKKEPTMQHKCSTYLFRACGRALPRNPRTRTGEGPLVPRKVASGQGAPPPPLPPPKVPSVPWRGPGPGKPGSHRRRAPLRLPYVYPVLQCGSSVVATWSDGCLMRSLGHTSAMSFSFAF